MKNRKVSPRCYLGYLGGEILNDSYCLLTISQFSEMIIYNFKKIQRHVSDNSHNFFSFFFYFIRRKPNNTSSI